MKLAPCTCRKRAVILKGRVPGTLEIGCWSVACGRPPVVFPAGDRRARAAAVKAWNRGYENAVKKETDPGP